VFEGHVGACPKSEHEQPLTVSIPHSIAQNAIEWATLLFQKTNGIGFVEDCLAFGPKIEWQKSPP